MITEQILTQEDIKLLKQELPASPPCSGCSMSFGCCGCRQSIDYDKQVEIYKQNHIYQFAVKMQEYNNNIRTINKLIEENKKIYSELPKQCQQLLQNTKNS